MSTDSALEKRLPALPRASLLERVEARWSRVRALLHGLRLAWVATASVAFGIALFCLTPQAQDLFLEVRGSFVSGTLYWVGFYLAVLLGWAMPVYVSSTWVLYQFRQGGELETRVLPVADRVRHLLPPMLVIGCFVAVLIGQVMALWNAPTVVKSGEAIGRNTQILAMTGAILGPRTIVMLAYFTILLPLPWLLLRRLLRRIPSDGWRLGAFIVWWIIAVLLGAGLAVSIGTSITTLRAISDDRLGIDHVALLPVVTAILATVAWVLLRPVARPQGGSDPSAVADVAAFTEAERRNISQVVNPLFQALVLAWLATFVLVSFVLHPVTFTSWVRRAHLVPFYLAFLVPILTWVTYWSARARAPLVLALVLAIAFVSELTVDSHRMRTVDAGAEIRPDLETSVQRWKAVNGCEAPGAECPRPIIVATAGGGSRAAFHTVGLLGRLLDETHVVQGTVHDQTPFSSLDRLRMLPNGGGLGLPALPPRNPIETDIGRTSGELAATQSIAKPRELRPFAKQLFAVSGVSGGAVGAAAFYAALADGQLTRATTAAALTPPCRNGSIDSDYFRPSGATPDAARSDTSWHHCLQLVMAGDFLSPVFASLMGSDLLETDLRGDRAVFLEQAWEARYAALMGQNKDRSLQWDAKERVFADGATLSQPLIGLRNRVLASDPTAWLPHLMLNGTSVATGRRIITSDLYPFVTRERSRCRDVQTALTLRGCIAIFRDAYDMHELMEQTAKDRGEAAKVVATPARPKRADVRLSTAALSSARFPLISPHGDIRRTQDSRLIDRVVDGGYYENYGAMTALELARELRRSPYLLKPFVILIENEPTTPDLNCRAKDNVPPDPAMPGSLAFTTITAPLIALWQTRSARGTHAAAQLCDELAEIGADSLAFIGVRDDGIATPVSWWLSKFVQRYLDDQLHPGGWNRTGLVRILAIRQRQAGQ